MDEAAKPTGRAALSSAWATRRVAVSGGADTPDESNAPAASSS
ncbi:hypothetical protein [Streptomyces sp. SID3343]|nr:hypothetical protein [Streptomyces sp. SID3343]